MRIRMTRLSNGMRIVTEHMEGFKSASLGIWVSAGGRHERREQNGIAHFLEHMAFKGTERRSARRIAEEIEDLGGYINAYTSKDITAYVVRVLENDVLTALDVISDIVLRPVFDPGEMETERGVILQEIGQLMDSPDDLVFERLQEVSYRDQPMGWSILGPAENVRSFKPDDLKSFIGEHYSPDAMILGAAGAVQHDEIVEFAERVFGPLPQGQAKETLPAVFCGGEHREVKDLEQAHFSLAFEGPNLRDADLYTSLVYSTLVGGGMSSRLFQTVREQHGFCYSIGAQSVAYSDTGSITIYAGTSEENIAATATLCIDELRRVRHDLAEDEVVRARTQLKAGMMMALESASSRSERLTRMFLNWNRVVDLDEVCTRIDEVNRDRVIDFADRICRTGDPAMSLYGPIAGTPPVSVLKDRLAA